MIDIKSSMEKEEGKYGSFSTEKNNDIKMILLKS